MTQVCMVPHYGYSKEQIISYIIVFWGVKKLGDLVNPNPKYTQDKLPLIPQNSHQRDKTQKSVKSTCHRKGNHHHQMRERICPFL